jgi:4-amino-4-deoxy-L-arabinose transferase-like glycosyltransferase
MPPALVLLVAAVAAALFLLRLGHAPFADPSEGFHAQVAREMLAGGDWVTPHVNGVRYFDKPPLLYWLMAGAFWLLGPGEGPARLVSALPGVGLAVVTAWLGLMLGSARLGLLAGLAVATNLGVFLYARLVKPDSLFVFLLTLGLAAFVRAYLGGRRGWLHLAWACLGLSVMAKDFLGALAPIGVTALFLALTGEARPWRRWAPWGGVALALAAAAPWYLLVEAANPGFLWYTVVDNHLLNFWRQRAFPDEDVPLSAVEFLGVTAAGFLPWTLALPLAFRRPRRGPAGDSRERLWLLVGLWAAMVVGFFTLSPFKLPHYGLPAFPALALLAARAWDRALGDSRRPWGLLLPALVALALAGGAALLAAAGRLPMPAGALPTVDVATRNLAAQGRAAPASLGDLHGLLAAVGATLMAGALLLALAAALRRSGLALGALVGAMLAFLPLTVEGFARFSASRSVRPLGEIVARQARPGDVLAHEGPLENSASWLLTLDRPVVIVNGLVSNLAFGATFPEAREVFWDTPRLAAAWGEPRRIFLLSAAGADRSAVRTLPADRVHLLGEAGSRRLYSNRP